MIKPLSRGIKLKLLGLVWKTFCQPVSVHQCRAKKREALSLSKPINIVKYLWLVHTEHFRVKDFKTLSSKLAKPKFLRCSSARWKSADYVVDSKTWRRCLILAAFQILPKVLYRRIQLLKYIKETQLGYLNWSGSGISVSFESSVGYIIRALKHNSIFESW